MTKHKKSFVSRVLEILSLADRDLGRKSITTDMLAKDQGATKCVANQALLEFAITVHKTLDVGLDADAHRVHESAKIMYE